MNNNSGNVKKEITFILGGLTAGGAERVATILMKIWVEQGNQVNLITKKSEKKDFYDIPVSVNRICLGGEGESSNKWIGFMKNAWYVKKLRRTLKTLNSDVVISFLTRQNIYAILATRGTGIPVIISERNDTTRQKQDWPWGKLREKLYKFADVVTANTEIALEGMKPYVSSEKLLVVPNPVEIPKVYAKPGRSKKIICVGRLEKVKNHDVVINAFHKSGLYSNGWSLNFFGEGSLKEILIKQVADIGLEDHVYFHGLVKDIGHHYQKGAMLVLASDYEGTPNALLEAMSYGLPGIISDVLTGALTLIEPGKNGLVFKKGDVSHLSNHMLKIAENPENTQKMGELARESVKKYSPDYVIEQWNALLN